MHLERVRIINTRRRLTVQTSNQWITEAKFYFICRRRKQQSHVYL